MLWYIDIYSEAFLQFLSKFAIVSTICLFLTGFEICWRIKAQGTTDGISSAPFHMGFISGQLWLQYGIIRSNSTVIFVNTVSVLLYVFYLFFYFMMATYPSKKRCLRLFFTEVICLFFVHYYINYMDVPMEVVRQRVGICCMLFNIVTVAAPLEALREVIRRRTTETMPLPLCLGNLIVTSEWLLYGILIDDIYLKIPNAIAVVISIAQIFPFLLFPRRCETGKLSL